MESVVRNSSRYFAVDRCSFMFLAFLIGSGLIASSQAGAASIEAVRGKTYSLSGKHGPWMIMVTSLWGTTPEQEEQAAKAASELVYQLRKKGIPAYTYEQEDKTEESEGVDRLGRPRRTKVTAQHGMIGVLAGNYNSVDDKTAQQTLKIIKKFSPKISVEWKGTKKDWPLVLKSAFITRNPTLPAEELQKKNRDPLIVRLNSNVEHSLFENSGKYTVIVASFYGQSQIKPKKFDEFDRRLKKESNISLDNAARESWELTKTMRKLGFDAYLYHERYRSIVTVGAFKSPNDPEALRLIEKFKMREQTDPKTKQPVLTASSVGILETGEPVLVADRGAESPRKVTSGKRAEPIKTWTMDPSPQLMEVPKWVN